MDERRFGAEVTEIPDEVRMRLSGDLNARADETLAAAYERVTELGPRRVSLDFSRVGYINSTGIALVVRLLAEARRDGRAVRALGLTEHYREIFRITRLSDFMEIVEGDAAWMPDRSSWSAVGSSPRSASLAAVTPPAMRSVAT